jgi:hypothetical protein
VKRPAAVGYSGTPLAQKLGIKEGSAVFVSGAPGDYAKLVAPLPAGVTFVARVSRTTDVVHIFASERRRLATSIESCLAKLRSDATIWVSWPKRASKVATDITEDAVRDIALPMGLVDVKVCAVDEVWSGLKLVIRKENR